MAVYQPLFRVQYLHYHQRRRGYVIFLSSPNSGHRPCYIKCFKHQPSDCVIMDIQTITTYNQDAENIAKLHSSLIPHKLYSLIDGYFIKQGKTADIGCWLLWGWRKVWFVKENVRMIHLLSDFLRQAA